MTTERQIPFSRSAEQSILGAMLLSAGALDKALSALSVEDFHDPLHREIFEAAADSRNAGQVVDIITIGETLRSRGTSSETQVAPYLTMLANETPGPANAAGYIRIVREKARARAVIEAASEATDQALTGSPAEEVIEGLQTRISSWSKGTSSGPSTLAQATASWLDRLSQLAEGRERILTGIQSVDDRMMGFLPSEMAILAGRPGMGKTSAAMSIVRNVAQSFPVLVFSLEMSKEQLVKRMATGDRIDGSRLRNPASMSEDEWRLVRQNIQRDKDLKMLIDDTPGITINQLEARARMAKREHGIEFIMVDYLQLLTARAETRLQEVSLISRRLKGLAKELDIPILVLSQLSRDLERRQEKRPVMSDLRESGQLEQDADVVVFLYRAGVYDQYDRSGVTEWIVAKHRDAEPGTAFSRFHGSTQRFIDLTDEELAEYQAGVEEAQSSGITAFERRRSRGAA